MSTFGTAERGRYTTEEMLQALTDDAHYPQFSTNAPDAQYPSHGLNIVVRREGARDKFRYETYSTGSGKGYVRKINEPGEIVNYVKKAVPADTTWMREH
jgi:hypothetical protein